MRNCTFCHFTGTINSCSMLQQQKIRTKATSQKKKKNNCNVHWTSLSISIRWVRSGFGRARIRCYTFKLLCNCFAFVLYVLSSNWIYNFAHSKTKKINCIFSNIGLLVHHRIHSPAPTCFFSLFLPLFLYVSLNLSFDDKFVLYFDESNFQLQSTVKSI